MVSNDQHIMTSPSLLDSIADSARLSGSDTVLEIGGGPGNLTEKLARRCGRLIVVEKSSAYAAALESKFRGVRNVSIVHGDILEVALPKFDKLVSNTPYSILQQLFMRFVRRGAHRFSCAVLVVPHGFARKITAPVGSSSFGALSALFLAFYDVDVLFEIGKENFSPAPRVRSACVRITPGTPNGAPARFFRQLFLNDGKKVKNLLVEFFWNGSRIYGRKLTKKEARAEAARVLSGHGPLAEKTAKEMSNSDFRNVAAALVR